MWSCSHHVIVIFSRSGNVKYFVCFFSVYLIRNTYLWLLSYNTVDHCSLLSCLDGLSTELCLSSVSYIKSLNTASVLKQLRVFCSKHSGKLYFEK